MQNISRFPPLWIAMLIIIIRQATLWLLVSCPASGTIPYCYIKWVTKFLTLMRTLSLSPVDYNLTFSFSFPFHYDYCCLQWALFVVVVDFFSPKLTCLCFFTIRSGQSNLIIRNFPMIDWPTALSTLIWVPNQADRGTQVTVSQSVLANRFAWRLFNWQLVNN